MIDLRLHNKLWQNQNQNPGSSIYSSTYLPTYLCISCLFTHSFSQSSTIHPIQPSTHFYIHEFAPSTQPFPTHHPVLPPSAGITGAVTTCLSEHELFRKLASSAGPLFLTNSQFSQF